jgi:hypothetical protein
VEDFAGDLIIEVIEEVVEGSHPLKIPLIL